MVALKPCPRARLFLWPETILNVLFPLDISPRKGYTISMKREFTERQTDFAIAIREIAKTPSTDSWGAFTDFTRAIASMLEGAEGLVHPFEMNKRFAGAWRDYAKFYQEENHRILRDCLGGQKEYDRVRNHPNGRTAIQRIQGRIKEIHGGLTPGMEVNVDIGDILVDELGETT